MSQKVLVVDDSPFIRRIISDWIKGENDLEFVGSASNGREAVEMAARLKPDVITLDVEMPVMDGLTALRQIMKDCPTAVIMVSSVTSQGASATISALEAGALDFVTKPEGSTSIKVISCKAELLQKIRASKGAKLGAGPSLKLVKSAAPVIRTTTDKVVVIASSTGGPKALTALWHTLPKGFPAPILIVQHMPQGFTESFAKRLDSIGTVPCKEAKAGDHIVPGLALLAPGGWHMTVGKNGHIELNDKPILHGTRPAADYLFDSALQHFGGKRLVGAVLTGMGKDGAAGAAGIVAAGGKVFGENEASCTIYGMPKAALQAGGITREMPIEEIGKALTEALEGRIANAS
ncbi:MAG: chemotaxis response regulator protein-glutamate methylesterase [Armatimonadetes bacterium]|nr:chemotaxis response regulator protein-glutamate methylesterase [Armatimonadota bacterium]